MSKNNPKNNRTRNAILWFLSPFLVLISIALVQFVARFFISAGGAGSNGALVAILNIFSLLFGIAAIFMFPVGIAMGIITLNKK